MSAIDALDLRKPVVIAAEHRQHEHATEMARYDAMWDWPAFPWRVQKFIETGKVPSTWQVNITYSTREFQRAMARAQLAIQHFNSVYWNANTRQWRSL
jgi:hypothetical protein